MQLPRADIIACKHCGAPVALIPRPAIVGRFSLTCQECRCTFAVWPGARTAEPVALPAQVEYHEHTEV